MFDSIAVGMNFLEHGGICSRWISWYFIFFHWNWCGQRNHHITVAATRRCLQTWVALFHFRRRSLGKWSTLTSFQLGGNENKNKPRRLNWRIFGSLVWCKAKVWNLKPKKGAKFGAVCPPRRWWPNATRLRRYSSGIPGMTFGKGKHMAAQHTQTVCV